ncbi:MAG: hypothetical protein NT093_05035, partial [Candidatus Moranbacteria bacterium]|nr:hypothetical protein [Candidatus Moranbacteria bacterium]
GSGGGVHGAYPEGKYGPGFYGTEGEGHGDIPKSTNERYGEGKYGPAGYGTENEGHGEITKSVDERYGHGKYGPSGHGTETEGHVNEFDEKYGPGKTGTEQEGHNVVAAYPEGKYGPLGHGTEGEGYKDIPKSTNERYGHGKYGPLGNATEADGHNLVDSHPEGKYGPLGHGTEQTGHIADMREVASGKFGSGGSIERASNNILRAIKANPAQYGLDSHDPNFSEHANNLREKMIEEFYTKKGFASYKDFDAYARSHVQPKDMFKIDYDPEAGKFHMSYEGKAFGPDVSGGGAAKEISHLEGGKLEPEEAVKPRTGAAHHPARGAGRAMHYEGDTPDQKIAKEDFAKASDYQKAVREFNAKEAVRLEAVNEVANSRLYLSTRGLLNQLVNGAGVGDKANFWQHSMNDWGDLLGSERYIAQDIQLTDEARVASFDKLKGLYPILERYHRLGFETIGECLKEAVKDPKILRLIDVSVLRK